MKRALIAFFCAVVVACAAPTVTHDDPTSDAGDSGTQPTPPSLECTPGAASCANGVAQSCNSSGKWVTFACDEQYQGMTCSPNGCTGACSPSALGESYIGCDYAPTVTMNPVWRGNFDFAVAVANASSDVAHVTITLKTDVIAQQTIAAGDVAIIPLPWIDDLKGSDFDQAGIPPEIHASVRSAGGGYRLRSDRPVSVYQFNALEYRSSHPAGCPGPENGQCYSYSNDASMLLPVNVLGSDYVASSYRTAVYANSSTTMPDYAVITAVRDGTKVTVTAHSDILGGNGVGGIAAGKTAVFDLDAGDVLELVARPVDQTSTVSGAHIVSQNDHPIQVVTGMSCVNVPETMAACDHVEEVVLPTSALGKAYVLGEAALPNGGAAEQRIRVQSVTDGTTITFDPAIAPPATLAAGEALEVDAQSDVRITSNNAFAVTHYMMSAALVGAGDPSESVGVPEGQWRSSYTFLAPNDYDSNFVSIVAPQSAHVVLDGSDVAPSAFMQVGSSTSAVARVRLSTSQIHHMSADVPFAIEVYGYGAFTSYMYPGGLDVHPINAPN
jgi:hypothetical protein